LVEDKQGMGKLLDECNFVDLYTTVTNHHTQFPTQARGSKKIDYLLGTRNIIPCISRIGYVTYNDGFDSDNRAIFADVSQTILSNPIQQIAKKI
jgi:hypothetical protein